MGNFAADSAALDPSMLAGVTQPLAAAAKTPIGPVVEQHRQCDHARFAQLQCGGRNPRREFPRRRRARASAMPTISGPGGARARVFGGSGVTYYWPASALRIDSNIEMGGGGLPNGRVTLRQPRPGAPMSGVADLAPYTAGGQRLALTPIRFGAGPGGSTALSTLAQLDGPFPGGRVQALRLPIEGRIGRGGSFAFGTTLRGGQLQLFADERAPARPDAVAGVPDRAGDRLEEREAGGHRQRALQRTGAERPHRQLAAASCCRGRPDRRQAVRVQQLAHAARQGEVADHCSMPAPDGNFAGSNLQRKLRRREGDHRQRPAAAQRRERARGCSATAISSVRQRADRLRPRREPALLSAA